MASRRGWLVAFSAGILTGCVAVSDGTPQGIATTGVPPLSQSVAREVDEFYGVPSAELVDWFENGLLVRARSHDGSVDLRHIVEPGSRGKRVVFGAAPLQHMWVRPGADTPGFLFTQDVDGSERHELAFYDWGRQRVKRLWDERHSISSLRWSPTGRNFALVTGRSETPDWAVVVAGLDGGRRVLIDKDGVGWKVEDWSSDETRILVSQSRSATEARLIEVDVATGEQTPIAGFSVATTIGQARYGGNDKILFTADYNADHLTLFEHDRERGVQRPRAGSRAHGIEAIEVSPERRVLAVLYNNGGYSSLSIERLDEVAGTTLPDVPRGVISNLRFSDEERLAMSLTSPTRPGEVVAVDLEHRSLIEWTTKAPATGRATRYIAPEMIEYSSFDGLAVPALLYRAPGAGPHPLLISLHGGPESQSRPRFSAAIQHLVLGLGISVILPNVRGSSGYGRRYLDLDNGKQREDAVRDVGALLDWVRADATFDFDRVAVSGGSYGGYLALASLALYGDRLKAGVDRMGISRFVTFLENTEDYRRDLRRAEYGDERDPEMLAYLEAISPLHRAGAIDDPVLIVQGANDTRVPARESEQMVAALTERGVPVWYVLARDEGHGFRRRVNLDYLAGVTAMFLRRHLLGSPPGG